MAQDLVVTEVDCGTSEGITMAPLVEGGDVVEGLGERVLGRTMAADVLKPGTEEVIFERGTLIDEDRVRILEQESVDEVLVRSPITCATRYGVCASAMAATSRVVASSTSRGPWACGGAVDRRAGPQ